MPSEGKAVLATTLEDCASLRYHVQPATPAKWHAEVPNNLGNAHIASAINRAFASFLLNYFKTAKFMGRGGMFCTHNICFTSVCKFYPTRLLQITINGGVHVWLYCFLNLGPGWGWMVNCTHRPLMRLGGSQGRSGRMRKISPPPAFDPLTVQPAKSRYMTAVSRLTLELLHTDTDRRGKVSWWNHFEIYLSVEAFDVEKPLVLVGSPYTQSHGKSIHHTGHIWQTAPFQTLTLTSGTLIIHWKYTWKCFNTYSRCNHHVSQPAAYYVRQRQACCFYLASSTDHVVRRHARSTLLTVSQNRYLHTDNHIVTTFFL